MRIIALADLHGRIEHLARIGDALRRADLVLLAGDLTHFGRAASAVKVVEAVGRYCARVLAVPGNCDYAEVGAYLVQQDMSLDGRGVVVDGVAFLGVGGSLPCPGTTPNERTDAELGQLLQEAAAGLDPEIPLVLISHQPPFHTSADLARHGGHVGSKSVRAFIEQTRPLICFTGHIHEGRGIDAVGRTRIVNPGPVHHGGYAIASIDDQGVSVQIEQAVR